MSNMLNKRLESRKQCFVPVDSNDDLMVEKTQTMDISSHGIGIISNQPHSIDEKIAIEIQTKAHTDPVVVIGVVKWVHRLSDSPLYRIGMNFDEIVSGSRGRLERYFDS